MDYNERAVSRHYNKRPENVSNMSGRSRGVTNIAVNSVRGSAERISTLKQQTTQARATRVKGSHRAKNSG